MIRDYIKKVEKLYALNNVEYKGLHLWLNLKNHFISTKFQRNESNVSLSKKNLISLFFAIFKNIHKWFFRYDYWFMGDSKTRKKINSEYVNIFLDYPASKLNKSLFIELPLYSHYKNSEVPTKNLVSKAMFLFFEIFYSFLFLRNIKIKNIEEVNNLIVKEGVNIPVLSASKKMIAQYKIMKLFLKLNKPKVVFLTASYSNYGYIKAFKEKGIKIVEIQHGVINSEHYGYNLFSKYDALYFPDYLITFGQLSQNIFTEDNYWLKNTEAVPIGNYYTDYICEHFQSDTSLEEIKQDFDKTVGVSLQDCIIGDNLIAKLIELANLSPNFLYILKPRRKNVQDYLDNYTFPKNIYFENNLNVYEIILHSDYHMTAYSSCAIEAPAMGVKNILFNLENKAYEYYSTILTDETTVYLTKPDEIIEYINSSPITDKTKVKKYHSNIIMNNYKQRMDDFIKLITV